MARSNNAILIDYLTRVKSRIVEQQQSKGIRLTGESANSLQIERGRSTKTGRFEAGAFLTSVKYLPTNFKGIGVSPGVFPPFGTGSELLKWVIRRGITTTDKSGRLQTPAQTSFLVARKINASGTRIFSRGGIEFEKIQRDEMPETLNELASANAAAIIEQWNKAILR